MRKLFRRSLMLAVGLAFLGSNPAIAADWSDQDVLDAQCLGYYAAKLGEVPSEGADPGIMILVGYFVGKIEGRNPEFDLVSLLTPDFLLGIDQSVDAISQRCAAERLKFVEDLRSAAEALISGDSISVETIEK